MTNNLTLDEIRDRLAMTLPQNAAFDGWGAEALRMSAETLDIDPDVARLAFPGGAIEMIDAWFATIDRDMLLSLSPETLLAMKIRERIVALIEARLALIAPDREALKRALSVLAQPQNLLHAAKLNWRAADRMWRAAGDTSTDLNHYSKRTILGGVYAATCLVFVDDESDDHAETRAFLARRIENIMQFEKVKAQFSRAAPERLSLARFLGRLRYPAV
jgi:ubiquinone biosynthesis protein COQ9